MEFKIGDRVKYRGRDNSIEIIDLMDKNIHIHTNHNRYKLKYLDDYNSKGTNVIIWIREDELSLDVEYYRESKLNILGI